jgi:hypothetical protein
MDKLIKRVDELEIKNRTLEFEVRKLKEGLILLEAKMNKKPLNYFDIESTDSSDDEHFYLDNINGV